LAAGWAGWAGWLAGWLAGLAGLAGWLLAAGLLKGGWMEGLQTRSSLEELGGFLNLLKDANK
jgi:hypothetical protein